MLWGDEAWNELSFRVLGCCVEVHRELGPGLLESVYADSLAYEMSLRHLSFAREYPVPVQYKSQIVGDPLRLDFLVEDTLVLEIKSVEQIHKIHSAQVLTYLKLTQKPLGLLVNFNVPMIRDGTTRLTLNRPPEA